MLQWWSNEDIEILKKVYPTAQKKEIIKALTFKYRKKTWSAIQKKASRLNIKRLVNNPGRPKKRPKQYLEPVPILAILFFILKIAKMSNFSASQAISVKN